MTLPAPPARRGGRLVVGGVSSIVMITGFLIDVCAIMNVPGAVLLPASADASPVLTGVGTAVFLVVLVCWPTVLWRASRPVVPLVAGGVLALIGVSYLLLLVGAVAYLRRNPGRLRPVAVAVVALVTLFALREVLTPWGGALPWFFASKSQAQQEPASVIATLAVAAAALGVAAAAVLGFRARARIARSDGRAAREQQRADALSEEMARQAERERIARDMHDALAHRLSVVSLHAGALEAAAGADAAGEIARTVREQTHAALQDMRGLIGELRSGPGTSSPVTMRALGSLIAQLRATGVTIASFVLLEAPERVSAQLDSAVHRIVQEALTNAIKHAPGAAIDVFVNVQPDAGVRLRIVNPLHAAVVASVPGGGHGTLGIRERAEALAGTAWIGPYEGSFIVDVTLPWQERG